MRHVPEIKLIRTDTTLDLSQKAEKVCMSNARGDPKALAIGGSVMGGGKKEPETKSRATAWFRRHLPKQVPASDNKSARPSASARTSP